MGLDEVCYIDFNWRNNGLKIMCAIYTFIYIYDEKFGLLSISLGLPSFRALQHWNEMERKQKRICRFFFTLVRRLEQAGSFSIFRAFFPFNVCSYTLAHLNSHLYSLLLVGFLFSLFFELKFIDFQSISLCVCQHVHKCVPHGMQFIKTW